jgi:hypothetical protein
MSDLQAFAGAPLMLQLLRTATGQGQLEQYSDSPECFDTDRSAGDRQSRRDSPKTVHHPALQRMVGQGRFC